MSDTRPAVSDALLDRYRKVATSLISDNLHRLQGGVGIRPFHTVTDIMVGRALTVKTRPGDNATIHQALDQIQPGDVIVVDGGGDISRALIGEIMSSIAQHRGAAGMIIDGAIRDSGAIGAGSFPVFARAAIHLGPYKSGPGHIGVPVSIGGMVVQPGDIIVGDDDGVVVVSPADAETLIEAVEAQARKEDEILLSIREGRYVSAYSKAE
jgi:RraA family protein